MFKKEKNHARQFCYQERCDSVPIEGHDRRLLVWGKLREGKPAKERNPFFLAALSGSNCYNSRKKIDQPLDSHGEETRHSNRWLACSCLFPQLKESDAA